jgi:hypothetical protein
LDKLPTSLKSLRAMEGAPWDQLPLKERERRVDTELERTIALSVDLDSVHLTKEQRSALSQFTFADALPSALAFEPDSVINYLKNQGHGLSNEQQSALTTQAAKASLAYTEEFAKRYQFLLDKYPELKIQPDAPTVTADASPRTGP